MVGDGAVASGSLLHDASWDADFRTRRVEEGKACQYIFFMVSPVVCCKLHRMCWVASKCWCFSESHDSTSGLYPFLRSS